MNNKQQLKQAAKEHKTTMGVLGITCTANNRQYIEGNLNLEALTNRMKFILNSGQFTNPQFQQDWNQYGEAGFIFEYITVITEQENMYTNYRQEVMKAEKAAKQARSTEVELY